MRRKSNQKESSDGLTFGFVGSVLLVFVALSFCWLLSVGPFIWAWDRAIVTRRSPLFPVVSMIYSPIFDLADNNSRFAQLLVSYERLWGHTNWTH
jgi:hypothetical protein